MLHFTKELICPKCGNQYLTRRRRRLWMRLIGVKRHLRCDQCRCQLLYSGPTSIDYSTSNED